MSDRTFRVVGGRDARGAPPAGPGAGDPDLVALLERLLFDARAGTLHGLLAVIDTGPGLDLIDHMPVSEWEMVGYLRWAEGELMGRVVG